MVSVCMATYNGRRYIRRQVESILSQLQSTDELIVSDDGSNDGTVEILDGLKDLRIKVFRHKPSGVTANFENAVRHSSGDYIFFADQDDEWMPNKVEVVLDAFKKSGCAVVQHDAIVMADDGSIMFPSWADQRGLRKGIFLNLVKTSYIGCCMAFRRELLKKALPFRGCNRGNLHDEWVGFVAEHNGGIRYIPDKLIKYCRHDGTVSQVNKPWPFHRQVLKRLIIVCNLMRYWCGSKGNA